MDRKFRLPRVWSNRQLRTLGSLFRGDVVNVSGWRDEDKQGGTYRNYFPAASSYTITNFGGFRGFQGQKGEILLDLEKPLPKELLEAFDVVFNHTTLEHIFDVKTAFSNLCAMSRDAVIVVVPFIQTQHESDDYKDYWRFTPSCLQALFNANGFDVVYQAVNNHFHAGIYVVAVASKHPEKWCEKLTMIPLSEAGWITGSTLPEVIKRLFLKKYKENRSA